MVPPLGPSSNLSWKDIFSTVSGSPPFPSTTSTLLMEGITFGNMVSEFFAKALYSFAGGKAELPPSYPYPIAGKVK
ncbi:Class-10 pathogenesis-related protein 1 [Senna tora]|uniref:Class-10 pathogenesis-related protein 1 n=1 Tax=Senna tora TaxID=362788 RepID=A0A834X3Q3_9FABA|nr:Class-10 pathogenesis-related protein 1 [Senna tora]